MNVLHLFSSLVLLMLMPGCFYRITQPLPPGLALRSEPLPVTQAHVLYDLTGRDASGAQQMEQQIFDAVLEMIVKAEELVVVDLFLFNTFVGKGLPPHRHLCEELTLALISRKQAHPALRVVVITDPINTVYGGLRAEHLTRLEAAGIDLVITDLDALRDSNPIWSSFWRVFFWPWGNSDRNGWIASPFGTDRVTLRSWMALINFKANHRKVVIADHNGALHALVTSANPHDGSSAHTNVGVRFDGPAAFELLRTELAVIAFSRPELPLPTFTPDMLVPEPSETRIAILTESAIADAAEQMIDSAASGDALDLVMFYLADRRIVRALQQAAGRGARIRAILDPNKDAFGRGKNGMPNRQTARELSEAGVAVRWADTRGEQMHAKLLLFTPAQGVASALLGSANFTRRNLRNFNLESNVLIRGEPDTPAMVETRRFITTLWKNRGACYTSPYETYHDASRWRTWRYRVQEATGLCTW